MRKYRVPVWNNDGEELTIVVTASSPEDAAYLGVQQGFKETGWRPISSHKNRVQEVREPRTK